MAGLVNQLTLEKIRSASDIVEVVGAVVPLKRNGANFVALCPFHKEKSPSFNVNPQKQIYRCFGCGKGGDVFRFLQDYENLTFMESVRRLAERARITLEIDQTPGAAEERSMRQVLFEIHERITERWQQALWQDAAGQIARDYLQKRGVSEASARLFKIGYAPDLWDDTVNWARTKKYDPSLVEKAGLIVSRDGGEGHYDRFRGRLMFPIADEQGRVIAFSGRILTGDEKTAKYVNSPETPLFTKGRVVFGLDKARKPILDRGHAVICEGQLDMIACFTAGIENAVAPQGTALTADHARVLKRYTNEIVLCFDGDSAGQKAMVRALDDLLASGLSIRVATIPAPHDPDSYIKEFGAEAFQRLITAAVGFFDFYLQMLCQNNDGQSDRGRAVIAKAMAEAVHKTGDAMLIETYARKTASRLGVSGSTGIQQFRNLAPKPARIFTPEPEYEPEPMNGEDSQSAPPVEPEEPEVAPSTHELWLLQLLCQEDDHLEWALAHLDFDWIRHPRIRRLVMMRLHPGPSGTWPSVAELHGNLEDELDQSLLMEASVQTKNRQNVDQQLKDIITRMRNNALDVLLAEARMRSTNPSSTQEEIVEALHAQTALRKAKQQSLQPLAGF